MRCSLTALLACAAAGLVPVAAAPPAGGCNPNKNPWSVRMATSIMSRKQGILTPESNAVSELLRAGLTQRALTAVAEEYHHSRVAKQVKRYVHDSATSVLPFVSNASYDAVSWPLDRLSNGIALLALSDHGHSHGGPSSAFELVSSSEAAKLREAAGALRESIDLNRLNSAGGLWYFVYPEWSYLDGMFSLAPFWTTHALYYEGKKANNTALYEMQKQLDIVWKRTYHQDTGLLVHGYDASKTAVWADPHTGASPYVWGRSLGWLAMALVDTLEILDAVCESEQTHVTQSIAADFRKKFRSLASAIIASVDPATGGWWQIVDKPNEGDNYIESSGSSMFAYALLKGARLGYIHGQAAEAKKVGVRAQKYLTDAFVVPYANGTLGWNGTVSICSLNSTATFEYYTNQPLQFNSVHGSASYILASVEAEKLAKHH